MYIQLKIGSEFVPLLDVLRNYGVDYVLQEDARFKDELHYTVYHIYAKETSLLNVLLSNGLYLVDDKGRYLADDRVRGVGKWMYDPDVVKKISKSRLLTNPENVRILAPYGSLAFELYCMHRADKSLFCALKEPEKLVEYFKLLVNTDLHGVQVALDPLLSGDYSSWDELFKNIQQQDIQNKLEYLALSTNNLQLYQKLKNINLSDTLINYLNFVLSGDCFTDATFEYICNNFESISCIPTVRLLQLLENNNRDGAQYILLLILFVFENRQMHKHDNYIKLKKGLLDAKGFDLDTLGDNIFVALVKLFVINLPPHQKYPNDLEIARLFQEASSDDVLLLGSACFSNNTSAPDILQNLVKFKRFEFGNDESIRTWGVISKTLINLLHGKLVPPFHEANFTHHIEMLTANFSPYDLPSYSMDELTSKDQMQFLRIQGRSLLFNKANGEIYAIKLIKKGEPCTDLYKQACTVEFLTENKDSWGLNSEIPTSHGVMRLTGITYFLDHTEGIDKDSKAALHASIYKNNDGSVFAYVYSTASENYFRYLHDATFSQEDFETATVKAISDLVTFLDKGFVFNQLADLFHERERGGNGSRYESLAALDEVSPGSLELWDKGVEYPNLRLSGLADEGDWIDIEILSTEKTYRGMRSKTANSNEILLQNISKYFGDILLIITLCMGQRAMNIIRQLQLNEQAKTIEWKKAAISLQKVYKIFAAMIALKWDVPYNFISKMLNACQPAHSVIAKSMGFWMDPDVYPVYIDQYRRLPDDIFPPETFIEYPYEYDHVNDLIKNLNNLGIHNGGLPLDERMLYLISIIPMWINACIKTAAEQYQHVHEQVANDNLSMALNYLHAGQKYWNNETKTGKDAQLSILKMYNNKKERQQQMTHEDEVTVKNIAAAKIGSTLRRYCRKI